MSAPLSTVSPLTYTTWLKYQENIIPDTTAELYTEYLHDWYKSNTLLSNSSNSLKDNYIQLLKDLSFLFGANEQDEFLANLDYANDEEIIFAIPYFVKKLKDICKIFADKRESIKNAKLRYNLVGSSQGLEAMLYEYVLKTFTQDANNISQVPVSALSNFFPSLSSVSGNFFIELEELHDTQSYHDSDPSLPITNYVDVEKVVNDLPFNDISENDVLGILSSRYLSRVADTPLSRLFNQYLLEVPSLSTAALFNNSNSLMINQIAASQKYLGETVYGLTAIRVSEISTPDFIMNLNFTNGNNWFYWPSGDRILDDSRFNNIYAPISINSSNIIASGATGGDDYTNSDLIFTDKNGIVEGAWLQGDRKDRSSDTMKTTILAGERKEFIFPYPGFHITSRGTQWGGFSITDSDYIIYEKLVPEQRAILLQNYYTQTLPNSASDSIYLNDSNLVYGGAYADKFSDNADTLNKRAYSPIANSTFSEKMSGVSQEAYLFKFDKTDFPISIGLNDIIWPLGINSGKNFPITVLNDTCLPVRLGDTNPIKTIPGAIAGNTLNSADVIYKLDTRTGNPIEAAWLGSGSIADLRIDSTIPVYDTPATKCSLHLEGSVQGALSTKIGATQNISFIWMDEDTPADDVIFFRDHAADCPYLKTSPHDFYKNQDYQNPSPLSDLNVWAKCRCKSVLYSPIGHQGNKVTDYNEMTDYLFADPQGLGIDFAFNSWNDTRGYTPLNSPQFAFYNLDGINGDTEVGWGTGSWKTGDGSKMILKTGRRYTYHRTSLRKDLANSKSSPYLIVNYPYKNIRGNYSNFPTQYKDIVVLIDKSYSQKDRLFQVIQSVREFVSGLINNSDISAQVSIVAFDETSVIAAYLTHDLNALNFALDRISVAKTYPEYQTDIYNALSIANYLLYTTVSDNTEVKNLYELCNNLNATILRAGTRTTSNNYPISSAEKTIILFSDGYENLDVGKAIPASKIVKDSGTHIYAIDVGINSMYIDTMEKIASPNSYFNLEKYLISSDNDTSSFVQFLISRFSYTLLSISPMWYRAIRDSNGNWIGTADISDMLLNPGDFLSYVHRPSNNFTGPNNTSFSTPAISFAVNINLDGWDYNTNTFSASALGVGYGAKPFWGKSYLIPEEIADQHFDKQVMSFGGQVRFIDGYLPIHQPEVSDMVLSNGSFLGYERKGTTNLTWDQPLNFSVSLSSREWKKIEFYKDTSNLEDLFRSGNNLDLIAYSSYEPSNIILESYSSFLPSRYNYFARNPFSYTQNMFFNNRCLTSFAVFNTAVAVEAVLPYANMDNIHFPTVATVSLPSLATTEKQTGNYLLPEKLGTSYYRGRGYSMTVSGDTLTFIDSISAERLFLDTNKYGNRNRGLSKNDQLSPVVIDNIDSRWMMKSFSSSDAAGTITDVLNNQKFTPYQSKYEITKTNKLGVSRQDDNFEFWTPPIQGTWNYPSKYPETFRKELLPSSYSARQIELMVNMGDMVEWKNDIFGNDYALFKNSGAIDIWANPILPPKKGSKKGLLNGDRVLVFEICNSNAARDDNFEAILNGHDIGSAIIQYDNYVATMFVGTTDYNVHVLDGQLDTDCPASLTTIHKFDFDIPIYNGLNTLDFNNIQMNYDGNYGVIAIRTFKINPDGSLSDPIVVDDLEYSGGDGASFHYTFTLNLS